MKISVTQTLAQAVRECSTESGYWWSVLEKRVDVGVAHPLTSYIPTSINLKDWFALVIPGHTLVWTW